MCSLDNAPNDVKFLAVTGQIDTHLIIVQLTPPIRQDLVPLPPAEPANGHAIAVETAKQLRSSSLQHAIGGLSLEVNLDTTWDSVIVALNSLDALEIGNTINQGHSHCEVIWRSVPAADPCREFEARRLPSSFCHGPLPVWNGPLSPKYLPIYFDVKYFYIKRIN